MMAVAAAHAGLLASIHDAAFPAGEQWDTAALATMLAMPGAFGFVDARGGFILARRAGGEAEILSLAVHPAARRRGLGRALVAQVVAAAADGPVFLEVAAENLAASALYASAGFVPCGRRQSYYGPGRDAVVLRHGGALSGGG